MNCRLPQTPRTPATAAAHYFDEVFSRPGKARKSNHRLGRFLRRSSTSRSIGNRSDLESSVNGGGDDEENEDVVSTTGTAAHSPQMEEHFTNYIADQLSRVRNNTALGAYEDELLTEADDDENGKATNGITGH